MKYDDYLEFNKNNTQKKIDILAEADIKYPLTSYMTHGAVLLMSDYSEAYHDQMIISTYQEGSVIADSHTLGIERETHIMDNSISFINRADITNLFMERHLCDNPDCNGCDGLRKVPTELIPYKVVIETYSSPVIFTVGSFFNATQLIETINMWRTAEIDFLDDEPLLDAIAPDPQQN